MAPIQMQRAPDRCRASAVCVLRGLVQDDADERNGLGEGRRRTPAGEALSEASGSTIERAPGCRSAIGDDVVGDRAAPPSSPRAELDPCLTAERQIFSTFCGHKPGEPGLGK